MDYDLVEIDGQPVKRKLEAFKLHFFGNGVTVRAGEHTFKVEVSPLRRPPNFKPTIAEFRSRVLGGKAYVIIGAEGESPHLYEMKTQN